MMPFTATTEISQGEAQQLIAAINTQIADMERKIKELRQRAKELTELFEFKTLTGESLPRGCR